MEVKFTTTETSKDTCSGEPPDTIGGANGYRKHEKYQEV
jgi:hypothetical protein